MCSGNNWFIRHTDVSHHDIYFRNIHSEFLYGDGKTLRNIKINKYIYIYLFIYKVHTANVVGVLQRTILSFLLLVGFKTSNKFSQPCPVVPMHYEANYFPHSRVSWFDSLGLPQNPLWSQLNVVYLVLHPRTSPATPCLMYYKQWIFHRCLLIQHKPCKGRYKFGTTL